MGQIAQCYQQFKQKALDRIAIDLCLSDKHFYLKLSWLIALFFDSSLSTFYYGLTDNFKIFPLCVFSY